MTNAGNDEPAHSTIRRHDRAREEGWIRAFLHKAPIGVLATVSEDQPFINTNLFVFDEARHALYLHTARTGRTRANIERNPHVCFSAFEMGRLLPADEALEFSVEYAGAVVFGEASIVESCEEKEEALQALLDKYAPQLRPGADYRPITADELDRTTVYRIDITEWSGKSKTAATDHPGAFRYGEPPTDTENDRPGSNPSI